MTVDLVSLGEICKEIYRYPTYYGIEYLNNGVPEVRGELITEDGTINLDRQKWRFISETISSKFPRTNLEEGDLIMSVRGTIGKVGIVPHELHGGNITANLIRISPNKQRVYERYLWMYMRSPEFLNSLDNESSSTTIKTIKAPNLKALRIPLPSLEEQKRIADILDRAEALRAKRRSALAQFDELTQSIFIEMFGDPARNTKNLPTISLGKLGEWQSGGTPPRGREDYFEGPVSWFSSGELEEMFLFKSKEHISEKALSETSAKSVPKGALMLGMYDTAALKASIAGIDCSCNQAIAFATLNPESAETVFVYFAILIGREHFRRLQRGVRQKNLNLSMVREICIPLPPFSLQQEFARRVESIEKLKATHKASIAELDELFSSLQYRAFRGEL